MKEDTTVVFTNQVRGKSGIMDVKYEKIGKIYQI